MITENNFENNQHTNKLGLLLRKEAQALNKKKKVRVFLQTKANKIINTQQWKY